MSSLSVTSPAMALLTVHWNNQQQVIEMRPGDRLFVGSDDRSDICIQATDVAPTHCVLTATRDRLMIEDCYSAVGTVVDGEKIRIHALPQHADVRIGTAQIKVRLCAAAVHPSANKAASSQTDHSLSVSPPVTHLTPPPQSASPQSASPQSVPPAINAEQNLEDADCPSARVDTATAAPADNSTQAAPSPGTNSLANSPGPIVRLIRSAAPDAAAAAELADLRWKVVQLQEENRELTQQLDSLGHSGSTPVESPWMANEHDEMLELLRAEVIDLQAQLSQQLHSDCPSPSADSAANSASSSSSAFRADEQTCGTDRHEPDDSDNLSAAESQRLLERLEDLLTELQQRDEQVALLSELLDTAEQAQQLEREERDHLDAWLKDIELRFGTREQEWQSERNELKRTIAAVVTERDQATESLKCSSAEGRLQAAHNLLQALRETADQQRQQLEESAGTILDLQRRLEQSKEVCPREELVELATLRAEVARLKHELEAARVQSHRSPLDESSLKLKALRQHLQEIHEVEVAQRAERDGKKLSHRLAKLWHRLEGR